MDLSRWKPSDEVSSASRLALETSSEGFHLLKSTLYELDPQQIPDNWV